MRDIRLFVAAYEERSFTAAAERENATQSGVSQHIRKLEDRHGVRLFRREMGRVIPTPAADAFYARCLELLRIRALADSDLKQFAAGPSGEVVVGVMPTISAHVLAPALMAFAASHPNVEVRAVEGYSNALTEAVLAGEIDFAIVPAQPHQPGLTSRPFATTPEILVSGPACGLIPLAPVRLAALAPLKLVLPGRRNGRYDMIMAFLAAHDIRVERAIELDTMMGTLDYVARSDWMAILPALVMAGEAVAGPLVASPFDAPGLTLELVTIALARAPMAGIAAAFHDALREAAEAADARWQSATCSPPCQGGAGGGSEPGAAPGSDPPPAPPCQGGE